MLNQNLILKNKGEKIMSLFKKKEEKKSCCCQCSVDAMEQAEETKKELKSLMLLKQRRIFTTKFSIILRAL